MKINGKEAQHAGQMSFYMNDDGQVMAITAIKDADPLAIMGCIHSTMQSMMKAQPEAAMQFMRQLAKMAEKQQQQLEAAKSRIIRFNQ